MTQAAASLNTVAAVSWALGLRLQGWSESECQALQNLAPALALIPDLGRWPDSEKAGLARIIRAKAGPDETRYVRLLQRHATLRQAILKLGSTEANQPPHRSAD